MFAEVAPWVLDAIVYMAFFTGASATIGLIVGFTSKFFMKPMIKDTIDAAFEKKDIKQAQYEAKVDKKFDDFETKIETKIDKKFEEFHQYLEREVATLIHRDRTTRTRATDKDNR